MENKTLKIYLVNYYWIVTDYKNWPYEVPFHATEVFGLEPDF